MTLTAERVRNLALNEGTSALAVRELVREHLWKEEWVATPSTLEAVAWVRARLREKPNDLRLAGPWQARPALRKGESLAAALSLLLVLALAVSGRATPAGVSHSATTEEPVRELKNGRLVVAPALQRVIAQHFPGFHQVGEYGPGDYDGNGLEDVCLYLSNRRRGIPFRQCTWLLVAFNQMPSGTFKTYVLARRPDPSTLYYRDYHRRSRVDDYAFTVGWGTFTIEDARHHTRQVDFRSGDVVIETGAGGWRLWYFRGGRYHWVWNVGDEPNE